jgi:hypothetical protein
MAQKDFVQPVIKVKKELTYDFKEFYSMLRSWLKDRGYDPIAELDHSDISTPEGGQKIEILLAAEKKVDPYVKLIMEIEISSNTKNVTVEQEGKKSTVQEGSILVGFGGYLKKDVEDDWTVKNKSVLRKFMRDVYDKYIGSDKLEMAETKLKDDIKKVIHDLKTYLKLHRFD